MAWIISVLLSVAVIILAYRTVAFRRDLKKLSKLIEKSLSLGISEKIPIGSSDKCINELAELLNRELSHISKLRSDYVAGDRELKEAVTNIAHDLRTPLTAVCGYLDLMSKTEDPTERRKYIAAIENRVAAITHLTEELFAYSAISSSGKRASVETDVRRVLEDTLVASYPIFREKGISPNIEIPESAVIRRLDPDALSRVFTNIISNAGKYSGGDFSVVMTNDCTISFSNRAPSLGGIDVSKLFDRFFTVDPSRHSTGLGLSIAKMLTEQMGGEITAEYSGEILCIVLRFE